MHDYDYDLFVIGAGSGGVRASNRAAAYGAKVAIAEEYRVGGTCVVRGCIPKKLFVYAAHYREDIKDAAGYGWNIPTAEFSWDTLRDNKDKEIDRLNGIYISGLNKSGVRIYEARAVLQDNHTVLVGGETVTAETILIATGGHPYKPENVPGIEHAVTSNECFHLAELPKRALVVGGGYIAVEFAGIFHGLGVDVTQIYRRDMILRGFDDDIRSGLQEQMREKGIDVRVNTDLGHIEQSANGLTVTLNTGERIETDLILCATGRIPNTTGLGLEAAGVETGSGGKVVVDEFSRTNVPNIYALGDVTDRIQLTPVAIKEAMAFVETVYNNNPTAPDHMDVPSAVFSMPPIGDVGLSEADARAKYGELDIYKSSFRALKNTLSGNPEKTSMKLIVDHATQRVVGAHMLGPDAAEIIQGIAIAIKMKATKQDFDATMAIHPSAAEEFVTMREIFEEPEAKAAE